MGKRRLTNAEKERWMRLMSFLEWAMFVMCLLPTLYAGLLVLVGQPRLLVFGLSLVLTINFFPPIYPPVLSNKIIRLYTGMMLFPVLQTLPL